MRTRPIHSEFFNPSDFSEYIVALVFGPYPVFTRTLGDCVFHVPTHARQLFTTSPNHLLFTDEKPVSDMRRS